jgi:hypothetical protein
VKRRQTFTAVLGVIFLILAVVRMIHPFGTGTFLFSPALLIVLALLLGGRYAAQREALKRAEILKKVPRRPLGL